MNNVQVAAHATVFANGHGVTCYDAADGQIDIQPLSGYAPYGYSWTPAVATGAQAKYLRAGEYSVTVTDAIYPVQVVAPGNCPLPPDQVRVYVRNPGQVYVPNVFSPNGDGDNDLFYVSAKASAINTMRTLQVFDRNGSLVFARKNFIPNDPAFGWDGTIRGKPATPAVFAWVLDVEYIDGQRQVLSGSVTVVR